MCAYQYTEEEIPAITVNQWLDAGLTYNTFKNDSKRGFLKIIKRGINGDTVIDLRSIQRKERREKIERVIGKLPEKEVVSPYRVEIDTKAREFYVLYADEHDLKMPVDEYTRRASVFNALRSGIKTQVEAHITCNQRLNKKQMWSERLEWYQEVATEMEIPTFVNVRSLERAFQKYCNEGYDAIIHNNFKNDGARIVSKKAERLILALWQAENKPYKGEVCRRFNAWTKGNKNFYDRATGEVFRPEDFKHKGRPLEISESTVWYYVSKHLNKAATAIKREGWYEYNVNSRPFEFRKSPTYSMSKLSMDDADLSRKMKGGDRAHRYMIFDVMSGYWFQPVYSRKDLTAEDVAQCFRNMFAEVQLMGLPMPGEVEHEHHLVDSLMTEEFKALFPFTTISSHSRNKRSEHGIRSLKLGVARENNHTRGRFYGKGVYRSPRFKSKGEFKEKEFEYEQLVTDDLSDIEQHNNSLHPSQRTYPDMTRKEVFMDNINRNLPLLSPYYLYRFIGNETNSTIRNNNYLQVNYDKYLIDDFDDLNKLKPNNAEVTAYWLPELQSGDNPKTIYLYQDDKYIGTATHEREYRYNESKFEMTDEDTHKMHKQHGRLKTFDKKIKEILLEVPKVGEFKEEVIDYPPAAVAVAEEYDTAIAHCEDMMNIDWKQLAVDLA